MKNAAKPVMHILRKDPCAYCGEYYLLPTSHKRAGQKHSTVDHIHPRAKGGKNSWTNYTAACPRCNSDKGDNSLLGHLLDVHIPSNIIVEDTYLLPEQWYDPLGVMNKRDSVDPRFVGLGSRERKVLRAKLAESS